MGKLEISLGWMMHDGMVLSLRIAHTRINRPADRNTEVEGVSNGDCDGGAMTTLPGASVAKLPDLT